MKALSVLSTLAIAALAGTAAAQVVNLGNLAATNTVQTAPVVVPASGPYSSYTVTFGWVAGAGGPWSNEARWALFSGATPLVGNSGNGVGAASSEDPVNLSWSGFFPAQASGTNLSFNYVQTFVPSDATWNNVTITFGTALPTYPTALNLGSINAGGPLTITTGGTLSNGNDTVLALFDAYGNVLGTSDDEGPSAFSQLIGTLGLGTYYAGVVAYSSAAGPDGDASGNYVMVGGTAIGSTTLTVTDGATTLNSTGEAMASGGVNWYSFEVVPTPGAAALLGLGGLAMARRRR